MGIKQSWKKFTGSANVKQGCQFDHTTGKFRCEKRKVHEDGTEEVIGAISGQLDGGCNPILDEMWETEEGTLNSINREFVDKIRGKCSKNQQNLPSDY